MQRRGVGAVLGSVDSPGPAGMVAKAFCRGPARDKQGPGQSFFFFLFLLLFFTIFFY